MKKLSEVIQISSNISKIELDHILEDMIISVESNLCISVEDGYEDNSFWISFDGDADNDGFWPSAGIIELDVNNNPFTKITSLAHEVGHYFIERDLSLGSGTHKIFEESTAWYLGYKYFESNGFIIDTKEYKKEMNKCLDQYVKSLSED